jgi:hypothetical protein
MGACWRDPEGAKGEHGATIASLENLRALKTSALDTTEREVAWVINSRNIERGCFLVLTSAMPR